MLTIKSSPTLCSSPCQDRRALTRILRLFIVCFVRHAAMSGPSLAQQQRPDLQASFLPSTNTRCWYLPHSVLEALIPDLPVLAADDVLRWAQDLTS